jgi:hypothetical protein
MPIMLAHDNDLELSDWLATTRRASRVDDENKSAEGSAAARLSQSSTLAHSDGDRTA